MFLTEIPVVDYADPWNAPFIERLAQLGHGSRHVAYIYPQPNHGTFRYRVLNMIEALRTTDASLGASWFSADEISNPDAILVRADVIVVCHAKYSVEFAQLVARARARGIRLLYDIDDLVFDTQYVHLVLNYLDHLARDVDFDYWFADFGRYGALMRLCDGVIVTNDYLAERVRDFCGAPTAVISNFMNRTQLSHSARILKSKQASHFSRDGRIHVGYFSGSPTHRRDFAVVAGAVSALMESDPRIALRIVGLLDLGDQFARYGDRVEVFPMQNILNLQRLIGEVEINVVPLQENIFTNCKSELKVFEASAVGTVSIASPSFALRRAIKDGETGFVAAAHRWEDALGLAIGRLESYADMAIAASEVALRRYVPEVLGATVIRVLFGNGVDGFVRRDDRKLEDESGQVAESGGRAVPGGSSTMSLRGCANDMADGD